MSSDPVNEPILKLNSVSSGYGKVAVLHEVSIELSPGEIVSIVGSNGAGKTTLLKTVSRFLPLSTGSIEFLGKSLNKAEAHTLVQLGIAHVPEGRKVFPRMSVAENLELGAYALNLNPAEKKVLAEQVFELFPVLRDRSGQLAGTLSGGEQQMLAIGRALMSKPKLLLLDEPSMGIAPILVEKIFQTVADLNRSGLSILLVEQDATAALSISARGYVLETGRVVLSATSSELLNHPDIKKAYLGC